MEYLGNDPFWMLSRSTMIALEPMRDDDAQGIEVRRTKGGIVGRSRDYEIQSMLGEREKGRVNCFKRCRLEDHEFLGNRHQRSKVERKRWRKQKPEGFVDDSKPGERSAQNWIFRLRLKVRSLELRELGE